MDKDIKEIADDIINGGHDPRLISPEIRKLAQYILNPWIPVSERLPEVGQNVLVYDTIEGVALSHRWQGKEKWYWSSSQLLYDVTHWMPLPPIPDKE